jgi:hypothetical protein
MVALVGGRMPRFVILRHEGPRGLHWDFMLQSGGVLRTWALQELPEPGKAIAAEALADHRVEYLEIEGPISGGRGVATRWDQGMYELVGESPSGLELSLAGQRIAGRARLSRSDAGWEFLLGGDQ